MRALPVLCLVLLATVLAPAADAEPYATAQAKTIVTCMLYLPLLVYLDDCVDETGDLVDYALTTATDQPTDPKQTVQCANLALGSGYPVEPCLKGQVTRTQVFAVCVTGGLPTPTSCL